MESRVLTHSGNIKHSDFLRVGESDVLLSSEKTVRLVVLSVCKDKLKWL